MCVRRPGSGVESFHFVYAFCTISQILFNYLVIITTGGMRALLTATLSVTVLTTRLLVNKCL